MRKRLNVLLWATALIGLYAIGTRAQTSSGGRISTAGATWDFSLAAVTKPNSVVSANPGGCQDGQYIFNTTNGNTYVCHPAGTFNAVNGSAGISITGATGGGITVTPSPLTGTGTIGLSTVGNNTALCNNTGSPNVPSPANCNTTGTGTLVLANGPAITNPRISTILDGNGGAFLSTTATGSATDGLCISPGTTSVPTLNIGTLCGSDPNVDLNLQTKGSGRFLCNGLNCSFPLGSGAHLPMNTTSIPATSCESSAVTVALSTVTTATKIAFNPDGDPTGATGYTPGSGVNIWAYPTAGAVNFKVCNASANPTGMRGAFTVNWIAYP